MAGDKVRVLELFSGIGGMHRALDLASQGLPGIQAEVVAALDINTVSNDIYQHNHPDTRLLNRNISGLGTKEVERLACSMVLMSPPCQPHTRQGLKKDTLDPRSSPLSHLAALLPSLPSLHHLLLENVAGFETSAAREEVVGGLQAAGWGCREFLLCPRQIGVPNSRLRYYLLARRAPAWGRPGLHREVAVLLPPGEQVVEEQVGAYLGEGQEEDLLEGQVLEKRSQVLDIVTAGSDHSCCFTAGYTRYSEGTGSVIQQRGDREAAYGRAGREGVGHKAEILAELGMRYFSSAEVARLLGFPPSFSFPPGLGRRQRYKALGNSLNVRVVALLIRHLLTAD